MTVESPEVPTKDYKQALLDASDELSKMFSGLTWITPLHGLLPIQAEATYNGQYFYFRARYDGVNFVLSENSDWRYHDLDIEEYSIKITADEFGAGVLSNETLVAVIAMFIQLVLDSTN